MLMVLSDQGVVVQITTLWSDTVLLSADTPDSVLQREKSLLGVAANNKKQYVLFT